MKNYLALETVSGWLFIMNNPDIPLRILLVDDSPTAGLFLQHKLAMLAGDKLNIVIRLVTTGEKALEEFSEKIFDLAILDVVLPGISGYDLCKKINAVSEATVAFLTALTSEQEVKLGFEAGCHFYIKKPAIDEDLLKLMNVAAIKSNRGIVIK